ncbi:MAG: DUF423 domain-containing protein [Bacteroidota bacterium]
MTKIFFLFGCVFSFLGVAFGAFGAHALKQRLSPEMLQIFEVGVRYQMYHAIALFIVAWALHSWNIAGAVISGWWFIAGIVLFSGSLYVLALSGIKWLGAVTPLGGLSFLIGWLWLAWSVWKGVQ